MLQIHPEYELDGAEFAFLGHGLRMTDDLAVAVEHLKILVLLALTRQQGRAGALLDARQGVRWNGNRHGPVVLRLRKEAGHGPLRIAPHADIHFLGQHRSATEQS